MSAASTYLGPRPRHRTPLRSAHSRRRDPRTRPDGFDVHTEAVRRDLHVVARRAARSAMNVLVVCALRMPVRKQGTSFVVASIATYVHVSLTRHASSSFFTLRCS